MVNYNSIHTGIEIDTAVTTINDSFVNQHSYTGVTQDQIINIPTVNDVSLKRLVQVYELSDDGGAIIDSSLDFDTIDESDYIQEDATNGTDFIDDTVHLHITGTLPSSYTDITAPEMTVTANAGTNPSKIIDNITGGYTTGYYSTSNATGYFIVDLSASVSEVVNRLNIWSYYNSGYEAIKDWYLEGSNTGVFGGEEVSITTGQHPNETTASFISTDFANVTIYRYFKLGWTSLWPGNGGNNASVIEIELSKANPTAIYTDVQPYYITTSNVNQLNLIYIKDISSVTITNTQPANTLIKSLVSFDGRTTWSKWNGSVWVDASVTDLNTFNFTANGNTIAEIQTGLTNLNITTETYIDFVFDLSTTDVNVTPNIDLITINYTEIGSYTKAIETDYSISLLDATTTRIKKLNTGIDNIKVNVLY